MARILVVDDDDQIRFMLRIILEREGYEVMDASDGGLALTMLDEIQIDLVVIDIIMPEKEGIQTIIEMRRDHPYLKIIAISGGGYMSAQKYLHSATGFGADLTLAKPIPRVDLLNAVQQLLFPEDQTRRAES